MTCPTCGHAHPGAVGADWCGCSDCFLLWSPVERDLMKSEAQERYDALLAEVSGREHRIEDDR